jgi:tRNA nucleotidyltransferase (CCA-adding enzyme)
VYLSCDLKVPTYCRKVIGRLQSSGFAAYAVGGAVRDSVMGRGEPEDWDVATSAHPEMVMELFPHSIPTGIKHGTVTVVIDGHTLEVTTFRRDEGYTDARHPDNVVFVDSIEEDLLRRDFTMNALAYDPTSNTLVDIVGKALSMDGGVSGEGC